jgi:hypothetical protein
MTMRSIHIGGASGFWGDSYMAAPQLVTAPKIDYLVFDYLAEITMSILARAKAKSPDHGYALDFVDPTLKLVLPTCAQRGIRIISNAGGVNPIACGKAIEELLSRLGLSMKVAVVTGDDLTDRVDELRRADVREMSTGQPLPMSLMSINAYLGAFPIARALDAGADIVITGRCVDSAVTLGPCIHAFGWKEDDYDALAGGSLAGHIIECGAQATGGLLTDWRRGGDWSNIGYPLAEVREDGTFRITKPEKTGGVVCRASVAEQLVYEIGDPKSYILPDVVCDFSQVTIDEVSPDEVEVAGAKGKVPSDKLKVCATYLDGYRLTCSLTIRGREADAKVKATFEAVLKRVRGMLTRRGAPDFTETLVEILGMESGYGPHSRVSSSREVVGRLSAKHPSAEALGLLLRELTSSGTSMAAGTTGDGTNRPKPSPVVRLFSFLIDRSFVTSLVQAGETRWETPFSRGGTVASSEEESESPIAKHLDEPWREVPLSEIAHGRSGDKGNDANIGIIARDKRFEEVISLEVTADRVGEYFQYLNHQGVKRYPLPGIGGWNFVLKDSLGGGGIASLRQDPQGKAFASILLDMVVKVPTSLLDGIESGATDER